MNEQQQAGPTRILEEWGDAHRLLIQTMVAKQCLSLGELKEAGRQILLRTEHGPNQLRLLLEQVNERLVPFHLKISRGHTQASGASMYMLLNLRDEPLSRAASAFSPAELSLLRALLRALAAAPSAALPVRAAVELLARCRAAPRPQQLQALLARWAADLWLEAIGDSDDCRYTIGVRALQELLPFFQALFDGDLPKCHVCDELIFHGQMCANAMCGVYSNSSSSASSSHLETSNAPDAYPARLHHHCAAKLFEDGARGDDAPSAPSLCPQCNHPWDAEHPTALPSALLAAMASESAEQHDAPAPPHSPSDDPDSPHSDSDHEQLTTQRKRSRRR